MYKRLTLFFVFSIFFFPLMPMDRNPIISTMGINRTYKRYEQAEDKERVGCVSSFNFNTIADLDLEQRAFRVGDNFLVGKNSALKDSDGVLKVGDFIIVEEVYVDKGPKRVILNNIKTKETIAYDHVENFFLSRHEFLILFLNDYPRPFNVRLDAIIIDLKSGQEVQRFADLKGYRFSKENDLLVIFFKANFSRSGFFAIYRLPKFGQNKCNLLKRFDFAEKFLLELGGGSVLVREPEKVDASNKFLLFLYSILCNSKGSKKTSFFDLTSECVEEKRMSQKFKTLILGVLDGVQERHKSFLNIFGKLMIFDEVDKTLRVFKIRSDGEPELDKFKNELVCKFSGVDGFEVCLDDYNKGDTEEDRMKKEARLIIHSKKRSNGRYMPPTRDVEIFDMNKLFGSDGHSSSEIRPLRSIKNVKTYHSVGSFVIVQEGYLVEVFNVFAEKEPVYTCKIDNVMSIGPTPMIGGKHLFRVTKDNGSTESKVLCTEQNFYRCGVIIDGFGGVKSFSMGQEDAWQSFNGLVAKYVGGNLISFFKLSEEVKDFKGGLLKKCKNGDCSDLLVTCLNKKALKYEKDLCLQDNCKWREKVVNEKFL